MTHKQRAAPPFSPILLAGFAMRPLPPALLQPALNAAMAAIQNRHPGVFDRLSSLNDPTFLIDPIDLPFAFILDASASQPSLRAWRKIDGGQKPKAAAIIRGPLLVLLDLLEGSIDGDAQFFSRDLEIEGDTEAVVALRNAVDGAEMDVIGDVLSFTGPFAGPARRAVEMAGRFFTLFKDDLETLRASVIAPAMRRSQAEAERMKKMEEKLNALASQRRKQGASQA